MASLASVAKGRLRSLVVSLGARLLARSSEPLRLIDDIVSALPSPKVGDAFAATRSSHNGPAYIAPGDLRRSEMPLRRALVVGSCLAEEWVRRLGCPADFVLVNNVSALPEQPPLPSAEYDFQIVHVPLRIPLPDAHLWPLAFHDRDAHERAFEHSVQRLRDALDLAMLWNRRDGLLTFVTNFFVPQQNPTGRWMPRYDLRNPVYYVERLNAALEAEVATYENAVLFDIDAIAAMDGRRYLQDDAFNIIAHGSLWGDDPYAELDERRIEPFPAVAEHYEFTPRKEFFALAWRQLEAMIRTLRRIDEVKLVIVDLDDTLWRGIAAEDIGDPNAMIEGWPSGLIEALAYLKKRGVLLAIVSKNEESRITALWDSLMGGRLRLDDFAVRKIDWRPKVENVHEVLTAVNVLPKNVVFIDDNPAERAAVAEAFPGLRVLGALPLYLRRILLWSPETQVAGISDESERRTELVQMQVRRDVERAQFPREEFLASLQLELEVFEIGERADARFDRVLELINKTNQFNTTGQRRGREDFVPKNGASLRLFGFRARDRFSDYGIVGAAVLQRNRIEQFVMSCRVIGLDIENAVVTKLVTVVENAGFAEIEAVLRETDANFPCRDLYARCGFQPSGAGWQRSTASDPGGAVRA